MAKARFEALDDLDSATTTTAIDISELEDANVLVGGTFVGTYSVEMLFVAGGAWVPHPSHTGVTVPKICALGMRALRVRVNCTAYTSGTLESALSGSDSDQRG